MSVRWGLLSITMGCRNWGNYIIERALLTLLDLPDPWISCLLYTSPSPRD